MDDGGGYVSSPLPEVSRVTTNPELVGAWEGLTYEINRTTASLLCLLRGMEPVREYVLPWYNSLPEEMRPGVGTPVAPSYVSTAPSLSGASLDLNGMLGEGGETEQLAFTGWIEEVYNTIWEGQYRSQLKEAIKSEGVVFERVGLQALGDIRLIRNDLVHNRRIAKRSAKCEFLKWFDEGDRMSLRMAHVFDFLNHMGLLPGRRPSISTDFSVVSWTPTVSEEDLLRRPAPSIVSVRVTFLREEEAGPNYYGAIAIFENGICAQYAFRYPTTAQTADLLQGLVDIDEDGNLWLGGTTIDRDQVYRAGMDNVFGGGITRDTDFGGTPGPELFRLSPGS